MSDLAVVIVTYKRNKLLRSLLRSIPDASLPSGYKVFVVDNGQAAKEIVEEFANLDITYIATDKNLGGSGGFRIGTAAAIEAKADWVWLMDDDVAFLPEAYNKISPFMDKFPAMIGERLNSDGSRFFFKARFNNWLAVPLTPLANQHSEDGYFLTDVLSFEGALISKEVFEKIGLPDERFFITWDDAIFGWQAAKYFQVAIVNAEVLVRTREYAIANFGVRPLQGSSDLSRYYMLKNRKLVKEYFRKEKGYSSIGFAIGTLLVFSKELVRLIIVEKSLKG